MKTAQMECAESAISQMLFDEPFYSALVMRMGLEERRNVKTFCTDGLKIKFNPAFAATLKGGEICTILGEEVLHVHLTCAEGYNFRGAPTSASGVLGVPWVK